MSIQKSFYRRLRCFLRVNVSFRFVFINHLFLGNNPSDQLDAKTAKELKIDGRIQKPSNERNDDTIKAVPDTKPSAMILAKKVNLF